MLAAIGKFVFTYYLPKGLLQSQTMITKHSVNRLLNAIIVEANREVSGDEQFKLLVSA